MELIISDPIHNEIKNTFKGELSVNKVIASFSINNKDKYVFLHDAEILLFNKNGMSLIGYSEIENSKHPENNQVFFEKVKWNIKFNK